MATLLSMRTEVKARGADYVPDARIDAWLNEAYYEICDWMPWPFLETEITGASPLTITDLGQVLSVVNSLADYPLDYRDRRLVIHTDDDLSELGTPSEWWIDVNTIYVWPGSATDTVTVRYIKTPTLLSASGDTPVLPTRWHFLITDGAVLRSLIDNDEYDAHDRLLAIWQRRLDLMVQSVMDRNLAGGTSMIIAEHKDY